jgi:hypothetical protein
MLDAGLLATGLAVWLVVNLATRWAPVAGRERRDVVDRLYAPVIVGVLAGRAFAAVLDDPASLRSIRAFLVVRGGVGFWPGVAVAVGLLAMGARRRRERATEVVADLTPFLLWGYTVYEAACVVRDGCYGPESPVGLTPPGLSTTIVPIGLVVAAAVVTLGFAVRHFGGWSAERRILLAVGGVALVRSVASIWLPRLGDGLTRQHRESLVVFGIALVVVLAGHLTARWRSDEAVAAPVAPAAGIGGDGPG